MSSKSVEFLKQKLTVKNFDKIISLDNEKLNDFLAEYIEILNPKNIFVCDDSKEDADLIKKMALETGEEKILALKNATYHFDGINDQARDPEHTFFLTDSPIDPNIATTDRTAGLKEIREIMKNIMKNSTMIIRFFSLGPLNCDLSMQAVQITDSPYVSHSEDLLYRSGYEQFKKIKNKSRFFRFVHSEGELTESLVSKNLDKRRIYIDLKELMVYSANTQYGGNTLGLKKLAMRLAIKLASEEGWLCEHMFLMGVNGPNARKTYFTGAFPSACGKTSTSMVTGENIVGDDIVYIKERNGKAYSVNVERGMFGIIDGVNQKDDPVIWDVLHSPKEIIFSNILVGPDNMPYWTDSGVSIPDSGKNFSGEWKKGKLDSKGKPIPASHKNARFTLRLDYLKNLDNNLDNPEGVEVGGMIYGGRDADTTVPVEEAFDWTHGIVTKGAGIESETTAAALGKQGVRKFNPMSNIEFLSVSIGKYIKMNIDFAKKLVKVPKIYSVNYFMKDDAGQFMSDKVDKSVWLKWMELRVNNEIEAIKTPTGFIPKYDDLRKLFKQVLGKEYSKELYEKQFSFRCTKWIEKLDRLEKQYKETIPDTPKELYDEYEKQRKRIVELQSKKGDIISPFEL